MSPPTRTNCGGWGSVDSFYRCAARYYSSPSYSFYHLGFRLAK